MTIPTLTPGIGISFEATELLGDSRVAVTEFADGYEQRSGIGLHPVRRNFQVSFTGSKTVIKALWDTLYGYKGISPFQWTPPDESSPIQFVCSVKSMRKKFIAPGARTFTALFQEDFTPP